MANHTLVSVPSPQLEAHRTPVQGVTPPVQKRIHALPTRFTELDGLRGLSALMVVAYHYLSGPAVYSATAFRMREIIYVSPLTVDMFFILSGFLVGGILLNTRNSPNYYKTFYLRRLYRVIPIYYLWIAVFVGIAICVPALRASLLPRNFNAVGFVAGFLFFVQNFPGFPVWNTMAHWLSTSWTLAIEEHFYLLTPICLHRLDRRKMLGGLAAIIALSPVARTIAWQIASWRDPQDMNGGVMGVWSPFRADGLAAGILLAILWQTPQAKAWICRQAKWIFACLMLSAPLCVGIEYLAIKHVRYAESFAVGFGRTLVLVSCMSLILLALIYQGKENVSFMRWWVCRELGKISYCMYLIHWGILWLVLTTVFHVLPGTSARTDLLAALIAFPVTIGLSELSWRYFEGPLQKWSHRFTY